MVSNTQNTTSFEHLSRSLLEEVQGAFRQVLTEAKCDSAQTAAELQRSLGLDKKLGWQVFRVIQAPSVMTAGFAIPSKVSTKRLSAAATKLGASQQSATVLVDAVTRFEQFVKMNTAGRAEFESIIADWAPDGRESVELANRRESYTAMSKLRGLACDTSFYTIITHPSPDAESIDRVYLHGYLGLRRLSLSARMLAEYLSSSNSDAHSDELALDGSPITDPQGLLLPEYCSSPTPTFHTRVCGPGEIMYWLQNDEIGTRSAVQAVFGIRRSRIMPRYATPNRPTATYHITPATPTQRVSFDCIVHEDLLSDTEPRVLVHETAASGPVTSHEELERREPDLLDWRPPARMIGKGMNRMQNRFIPRYTEMLAHACEEMGWNLSAFACYRIEVEYPVHSWQISLAFPKASRPE